jgi:hypothetical protein
MDWGRRTHGDVTTPPPCKLQKQWRAQVVEHLAAIFFPRALQEAMDFSCLTTAVPDPDVRRVPHPLQHRGIGAAAAWYMLREKTTGTSSSLLRRRRGRSCAWSSGSRAPQHGGRIEQPTPLHPHYARQCRAFVSSFLQSTTFSVGHAWVAHVVGDP